MPSGGRVVIVEDEFLTQLHFQDMVEEFGYEVCGVTDNAAEALALVKSARPHAVLMDVRLRGDGDGVDAALEIAREHGIPVLYVTASDDPETVERIGAENRDALLVKPVTAQRLKAALARALEGREAEPGVR